MSFTHDNKGLFYQSFPEPVGVQDAGTEIRISGHAMVLSFLKYSEQSYAIILLGRNSLRIS